MTIYTMRTIFNIKRLALILFVGVSAVCHAQHIAVKTNLLYDVFATANIGMEFRMAQHWTMDISANYNPLEWGDDRKVKHWMVQPEARYWFCDVFNGHFLALHALGGAFNVGNVDLKVFPSTYGHRYQGNMIGAGIGYGYQFVLNRRINIGLELGGGWINVDFDKYAKGKCGELKESAVKNYFGLTKAAVSFIYILR